MSFSKNAQITHLNTINRHEVISKVLACISADEPVIIPTDTVYGFFAPGNKDIFEKKIRKIKVRDEKPFIYLVSDFNMLKNYSKTPIPEEVLAKLPGEVTLIVESSKIKTKDGSIGLRYPNNALLNQLVEKIGCPCISTSANISGKPAPKTDELLVDMFKNKVPLIVLSSQIYSTPSTIVDIRCSPFKILRQGKVYL